MKGAIAFKTILQNLSLDLMNEKFPLSLCKIFTVVAN